MYIDDPKYNLLVTSSNDGKVRMYKYSNKGFVPADDSNQRDNELNLTYAQMVIVWDYVNEILYSGQRNGVIRIWEQKSVGAGNRRSRSTRRWARSAARSATRRRRRATALT